MADVGVQATELSAPQGAGANVVKPATASVDLSGFGSIFSVMGSLAKISADKERQEVIRKYTSDRDKYAQAVQAGADLPKVNARRRAAASEFRANYPKFIKDFDEIDKSFSENTAISEAEDDAKMRRDIRKEQLSHASSMGYPITASTSQETLDAYADLSQSIRRQNAQLDSKIKQLEYEAKLFGHDKNVQDKQRADVARQTLSEAIPVHLITMNSFLKDMAAQIASNPESFPEAMMQFRQLTQGLTGQLAMTKESLPGVYEVLVSMTNDLYTTAEKLLDPKTKEANALERVQNRVKLLIEKTKLSLLQTAPGAPQLAASTQLFGDNILTQLGGIDIANRYILPMIDPSRGSASVPPVVNQPPSEQRKTFQLTAAALDNALKSGTPESLEQGKRLMEGMLDQARAVDLQENVTLEQIAPIVDFLADPTTRDKLVKLKVDPSRMNNMVSIMERYYHAQIAPAIEAELNQTLKVGSPVSIAARGMLSPPVRKDVPLASSIHIESTPTGIKVVPKAGVNVDVKPFTKNMEKAITKGLQAEANLSGKSLEQVWSEKAHILFPDRYPPNFTLKPGDKIPGTNLVYIGGFPIGDETSYRKTN